MGNIKDDAKLHWQDFGLDLKKISQMNNEEFRKFFRSKQSFFLDACLTTAENDGYSTETITAIRNKISNYHQERTDQIRTLYHAGKLEDLDGGIIQLQELCINILKYPGDKEEDKIIMRILDNKIAEKRNHYELNHSLEMKNKKV